MDTSEQLQVRLRVLGFLFYFFVYVAISLVRSCSQLGPCWVVVVSVGVSFVFEKLIKLSFFLFSIFFSIFFFLFKESM